MRRCGFKLCVLQATDELIKNMAIELVDFLNLLFPLDPPQPECTQVFESTETSAHWQAVSSRLRRSFGATGRGGFPGAMPLGLSRVHLRSGSPKKYVMGKFLSEWPDVPLGGLSQKRPTVFGTC